MKILQISTGTTGGAGIACLRLHGQLKASGIQSKVLCMKDKANAGGIDPAITPYINQKKISYWPNRFRLKASELQLQKQLKNRPPGYEVFSSSVSPFDITSHPFYKEADIIHLHWTAHFLDHRTFFARNNKPVVFTLHDMFPFTGGCHHADGCMKFTGDCDSCPQLRGTIDDSYAASQLAIKLKAIQPSQAIHIASPSIWLQSLSKQSRLFKSFPHTHVSNGFNESVFKVLDKSETRKKLGIPDDKPVLLFVAESIHNHRKGFHILQEALQQLDTPVTLMAMGANKNKLPLPQDVYFPGRIQDEQLMAQCYNAADMFVLPSLAENLPNTIAESLLCGTPVTAFNAGGIGEMIVNYENGWLCDEMSVRGLLTGIKKLLENKTNPAATISEAAAKKYSLKKTADTYISIYRELYSNHHLIKPI
jgi:glycosyltransferase involved in cell wall biosynthesis